MEYYCENCDNVYTIPQGDILIEKNITCKCGRSSKFFKLTTTFILKNKGTRKQIFEDYFVAG